MIFENDDDIGYFNRPSHGGYPSNPKWSDYDTLTICNGLIGRRERDRIVRSAILAHEREPLQYDETT